MLNRLILSLFTCLTAVAATASDPSRTSEVPNFSLLDYNGRYHELHRVDGRVVVLFFTGNGCPIARQSIGKLRELERKFGDKGVVFWMIDSYANDDRDSIRAEANLFRAGSLPVLLDQAQGVAISLNVQRTAEAVAIDTRDWTVFFRGGIDDQASEGAQKPAAMNHYLASALNEFLSGEKVSIPRAPVKGCLITFDTPFESSDAGIISYAKQVAPLLADKCASCHSPGNVGPFAMTNFQKVKNKARMIEEVVLTRRMPPWDADPHYGKFKNDRSLSARELQTLVRWVEQGAPRGDGEDPLEKLVIPVEDWPLGKPDRILAIPEPQQIPATGVLDYRRFKIRSPLTNNVWLGALVIHPGNPKVVHHVLVRVNGVMIGAWAPGTPPVRYPPGTGGLLPKGVTFEIEMHYTTMGAPQVDQTEIGLYFLPEKPARRLRGPELADPELSIPPGEPDSRQFAVTGIKRDTLIYSITPHMHTRGSCMQVEALYPDGKRETLLSVPHYDFQWQTTYYLADPKLLPGGTWLLATGAFDNSARNPNNPDPTKRITWGEQTWNEMFLAFMMASDPPIDAGKNDQNANAAIIENKAPGLWRLEAEMLGIKMGFEVILSNDQGKWTGAITSDSANKYGSITSVVWKGRDLNMEIEREIRGYPATFVFEGTIEAGELRGTVAVKDFEDQFNGKWKARRVTEHSQLPAIESQGPGGGSPTP